MKKNIGIHTCVCVYYGYNHKKEYKVSGTFVSFNI